MDYETPDPQSLIHTDDSEDGFVQVPEHVDDEMSSSPELINMEDEEGVAKNVNDFIVSKDEDDTDLLTTTNEEDEYHTDDKLVNLEREVDDFPPQESFPAPKIQNLTGGIEDVGIKASPHIKLGGSPSRPSTKTVETPRASGYLSFLNALHPFVLYLIYWRDIKLSVLSLGMTMIVLLTLYVNTVLHTIILMLLAAMVVSLVYIVTKIAIDSFYNRQIVNPFLKYLEQDISLPEDDIIKITRIVVERLNCYFRVLMKTIFFEETLKSLKKNVHNFCLEHFHIIILPVLFCLMTLNYTLNLYIKSSHPNFEDIVNFMVALFFVSYFTNYLNVLTSIFISVTMMFTIPLLYSKYQKPVDDTISKVISNLNDIYSRVVEKIPFLPKLKSE